MAARVLTFNASLSFHCNRVLFLLHSLMHMTIYEVENCHLNRIFQIIIVCEGPISSNASNPSLSCICLLYQKISMYDVIYMSIKKLID